MGNDKNVKVRRDRSGKRSPSTTSTRRALPRPPAPSLSLSLSLSLADFLVLLTLYSTLKSRRFTRTPPLLHTVINQTMIADQVQGVLALCARGQTKMQQTLQHGRFRNGKARTGSGSGDRTLYTGIDGPTDEILALRSSCLATAVQLQ